jgi:hypothetical protein
MCERDNWGGYQWGVGLCGGKPRPKSDVTGGSKFEGKGFSDTIRTIRDGPNEEEPMLELSTSPGGGVLRC